MDLLTSMRVFMHIANQQSFRGAAESLNMTPSAISKHLASLEAHLGSSLIERTTRRVTVTEVGQNYLTRCRHILSEVDEAEIEVSDATDQVRGILKVSAPPAFAHRHIAPHLPDFLQSYPQLSVDLITTDHSILPTHTIIDVHIRLSSITESPELETVKLAPNRRRLVASQSYLERFGIPNTQADLRKHKLVTLEYGHPHNDWHFTNESGGIDTFRASGAIRIDSGDALLRTILNDGGIGMLPNYVTGKHIHMGDLVPVMDELVREDEPIHATFRAANHRRQRIDLFVKYLSELYGSEPYWEQEDGASEAAKRAAR